MPWIAAAAAVGGALLSSNSSSKARKASQGGQAGALQATRAAEERATSRAIPLFDASQQNALAGFQGALDIQGQFAPEQVRTFQQGNLQAQDTMRAGLDPQIAAILGGQVDLSGLQTQQVQAPDPSMFQQQLPEFRTIAEALPELANKYIPEHVEAYNNPYIEQLLALQQQRLSGGGPVNNPHPNVGLDSNMAAGMDFSALQGLINGPQDQVGWGGPPMLGGL